VTGAASAATVAGLAALLRDENVEWPDFNVPTDEFVAACEDQQVTGLVERCLRTRSGRPGWPGDVHARLRARVRADVAADLIAQRELVSVLDALANERVFPIVLKGTALAFNVYETPSLRPRFDTDLWVRHEDAGTLRTVLGLRGYTAPIHCEGDLLFCQFPLRRRAAFGLEHRLDVHWKISTQSVFAEVLSYDATDGRTVPVPALGPHARTLPAGDALLLACIHPVMHHRAAQTLIWIYDVHQLATSLDEHGFARFADLAVRRQVAAVCLDQLALAHRTFGTIVPRRVTETLSAAGRSEPSANYLRKNRRWIDEVAWSVRGLARWRDRARLVAEIVLPRAEYMLRSYGCDRTALTLMLLPALYVHRALLGGWKVLAGEK
jgi:putative nucleotidyltransferase-like protein